MNIFVKVFVNLTQQVKYGPNTKISQVEKPKVKKLIFSLAKMNLATPFHDHAALRLVEKSLKLKPSKTSYAKLLITATN